MYIVSHDTTAVSVIDSGYNAHEQRRSSATDSRRTSRRAREPTIQKWQHRHIQPIDKEYPGYREDPGYRENISKEKRTRYEEIPESCSHSYCALYACYHMMHNGSNSVTDSDMGCAYTSNTGVSVASHGVRV